MSVPVPDAIHVPSVSVVPEICVTLEKLRIPLSTSTVPALFSGTVLADVTHPLSWNRAPLSLFHANSSIVDRGLASFADPTNQGPRYPRIERAINLDRNCPDHAQ
jgi:hypothetical protein